MKRLEALKPTASHELLGPQNLLVYQITYDPLAPHTLPGTALLKLDRRLIPGDDPDRVVDELRAGLGNLSPYEITVEQGVFMLPALVNEDAPVVKALQSVGRRVMGTAPEIVYPRSCFDAGALTSVGIPAVHFGASGGGGDIVYGEDWVSLREVVQETKILAGVVGELLG